MLIVDGVWSCSKIIKIKLVKRHKLKPKVNPGAQFLDDELLKSDKSSFSEII